MKRLPVLALLLATSWVYADSARWLLRRWFEADGTVHLVLAGLLVVLLARDVDLKALGDDPPHPPRSAVLLVALTSVVTALLYPLFPANSLLATAAILTFYGVSGALLSHRTWVAQRSLVLLALAALPISGHLDTLVGFPLRAATASVVSQVLGASLDSSTVLSIEGGAAHIDVPCSGVQSLWSAAVVLAAAAALRRHRIGPRWLGAYAVTIVLLLLGNLARVTLLVVAHHRLQLPLLAEIIHLPLGIAVFLIGCAPGLWLVRRLPTTPPTKLSTLPSWSLWPAAAVVAAAGMLMVAPSVQAPTVELQVPPDFVRIDASGPERNHAARQGAALQKVRFDGGSAVFVLSGNWRAHHVPEQCHTAGGWDLSDERIARVSGKPVRWAAASRGTSEGTVFWWFQRQGAWTEDHNQRIAEGLLDDRPWVLVSVLLDHSASPESPEVHEVVSQLSSAATRTLEST